MSKTEVLLLYGGKSGEHEVSCRSAASICRNIDYDRFSLRLCGICRSNRWFLQPDQVRQDACGDGETVRIEEDPKQELSGIPGSGLRTAHGSLLEPDIVFPLVHGTFGEDGSLQGYMETLDLDYVGSRVFASAACFDKRMTKHLCSAADIPCVEFLAFRAGDRLDDLSRNVSQQISSAWPGRAVFVKPARCGSSVGVTRVEAGASITESLRSALEYDHDIMIEPEVRGRELECAVTGNHEITAHAVGEVQPVKGFYDYRTKYLDENGAALIIPADINQSVYEDARRMAADAYKACDCSGFARVDMFYSNDTKELLLNEINTIPGFTSISMFPSLCREHGISYTDLISLLIDLGIDQGQENSTLRFDFDQS